MAAQKFLLLLLVFAAPSQQEWLHKIDNLLYLKSIRSKDVFSQEVLGTSSCCFN